MFLGLKGTADGGAAGHGGPSYSYSFHGDPHAMFAEFFGSRSPFHHFFPQKGDDDMDISDSFGVFGRGQMGGMGCFQKSFQATPGGHHRAQSKKKDPPVVHELKLSLEEVFSGCTKKMKISRKRLNPDGRTVRSEDKILMVDIKRGWKEGTKITFPREGDETPTNIPADVVFVVKDKPHPVFKRNGSDIIYPAKISLRDVSEHLKCPVTSDRRIGLVCLLTLFCVFCRRCVVAQSRPRRWMAKPSPSAPETLLSLG